MPNNIIQFHGDLSPEGYVVTGLFIILLIIAHWRIFAKAGRPGWAVLIPIYNAYVLLKIVGRSGWWLLLFLIPGVNVIIWIIVMYDLAKSFGKGIGYTLILLIIPNLGQLMLAFGNAKYKGPRKVSYSKV